MSTIFLKIISREIPADIVYEDDTVLAFLDIKPINIGHTLVIPKKPSENGLSTSPEDLAAVMIAAQKVANALIATLPCDGINFIMNNGAAASQEVFHTHLHVVPRFTGDDVFQTPTHTTYRDGQAVELAASLRTSIAKA